MKEIIEYLFSFIEQTLDAIKSQPNVIAHNPRVFIDRSLKVRLKSLELSLWFLENHFLQIKHKLASAGRNPPKLIYAFTFPCRSCRNLKSPVPLGKFLLSLLASKNLWSFRQEAASHSLYFALQNNLYK